MSSSYPLSILFDYDATRSLITDPSQLDPLLDTEEGRASCCAFKRTFKHYPEKFLEMELDRRNRCTTNGVNYVPPKLSDSADATFERIKKMNRAIKTSQEKKRRLAMTPQERRKISAKRAESRRRKLSRETEEDTKQRLDVGASYRKGYRERKFEAECKKRYMKYPQRGDGDTISMVRARRREHRDMIESRWFELNENGYPQDNVPDPYSFGDVVLQCHARRARGMKGHASRDSYKKTLRACLKCKKRDVAKKVYKNGRVLCFDCEYGHNKGR